MIRFEQSWWLHCYYNLIEQARTMSTQIFDLKGTIEFDKLEAIFVDLAPAVFSFFHKDPGHTIITVSKSETVDLYADCWVRHCLSNDNIRIEILQQSSYHDNSMTAEWLYDIRQSIQYSSPASDSLRLFINSLSSPVASKLFYEVNPEYQAFTQYYLAQLQIALAQNR